MQHFPVFLDMDHARVVIGGGDEIALAKLRLLLKTRAAITLCAPEFTPEIEALRPRVTLVRRPLLGCDLHGARLVYAATGDADQDARIADLGRRARVLVNIVDNLEASDFITPAIVDRAPVVVAIGTEGAAPVLARKIKAQLESALPTSLGVLARIGKSFRQMAEALPMGAARRNFWAEYYDTAGPRALDAGGTEQVEQVLDDLLAKHLAREAPEGWVDFVSAGPGDPDLMTLKARKLLDRADVVIHDRLVSPEILELARREALMISVGKEGFGPSTPQAEIHRLMIDHAAEGAHVVRLKGGDASVFGRLDEETEALDRAEIRWTVVPGVTAASAAAAGIGQSLTARGRNQTLRLVTAHDVKGYADQDWRALAAPGAITAIYMGKRAARFVQGRLLMHGAQAQMPVALVENASRTDQRIVATTLAQLPQDAAALAGPTIILLGLAARTAAQIPTLQEQVQ
ncbi:MAG: uroporphyrinogen-III C-methyltransferase [Rhodobacteraceae bacterium]|nr:MAG: uroporphyrinogen-III C-methyltransferase [Paracoccaceae bacterium]